VRSFLQLLLTHVAFHACTVVVVLVSSGAMAFKNPIAAPDTGAAYAVGIIDTVAKSWRFINGCYLVIFANFLTLAINHYPAPDGWAVSMNNTEIVFTALFAFEAVMKIFGEGMTTYFASNWNRFDFFVVVISILSVSLRDILNSRLDALFRSLRVLRLARIIRGKSSLSELVHKFGMAVASLGGVAAIIFVFSTCSL
jgi:hypothetical protein